MLVFDVKDFEKHYFLKNNIENFDITLYPECLNENTVKNLTQEELDNTMAISVFIDSDITESVINSFKNLRIISTRSSTTDHINKKAAEHKNISIVNVEKYSYKPAAQFTMCLITALVRCLIPASKTVEQGRTLDYTGYDLSKMTLGVVGTGLTGAEVCKIAQAIGMKVLAYDIFEKQELLNNTEAQYVDLETLLKESDIVSVHIPYTTESRNLITKNQLDQMKKSAYLVNTSKSGIVNLTDLYNALKNKQIRGAALDIKVCNSVNPRCAKFENDMHINLECYEETKIIKKLTEMQNVIITPFIAHNTEDVLEYILNTSIRGILDCIKGGSAFRVC